MNISHAISRRSISVAAVAAFAGLAMLVPASSSQTPEADMTATAHPAHIHLGTCAELGEVVAPLTDLTAPEGEASGATTAVVIKTSHTVIDMPLQEIIDGGHAINVHLSSDDIGTYIACGDIGGVIYSGDDDDDDDDDGDDQELLIGLVELNDSGHYGTAWLGSIEDGTQTEVVVTLVEQVDA